ncbi:MAG TPA: hypothetical protein VMO26_20355 [Vicinamibacterales bacterium]|nr:hypothetical protein [Vicinamibacterales bacterium]
MSEPRKDQQPATTAQAKQTRARDVAADKPTPPFPPQHQDHPGLEQRMTPQPAQPEEVAPAFVFFASQGDSSYITGEVLTLLGGETRAG